MVLSRTTQTHVVVGNINLDISLNIPSYPEPDGIVYARDVWLGPGGAAVNYSIAVARLGHRSVLFARASRTLEALGLIDSIKREGVDTSSIIIDDDAGTRVVVILSVPAESSRALIKSPPVDPPLPDIIPEDASTVHLATVSPIVLDSLRINRKYSGIVSYDPGGIVVRSPSLVVEHLDYADIVFFNNVEIRMLEKRTGVNPLENKSNSSTIIVVKHGDGGASVYESGRLVARASPPVVDVVDVTGAGDAFDAAFMVYYLDTGSIIEALRYAVAAGSAKVRHRGSSAMPSLEEIKYLSGKVNIKEYST